MTAQYLVAWAAGASPVIAPKFVLSSFTLPVAVAIEFSACSSGTQTVRLLFGIASSFAGFAGVFSRDQAPQLRQDVRS